ncbi:MAG TPA: permease-like cell division protein FtsX [Myxococcota bacterium]|nr:permease-like cell division protein FtsX [Myxococcota bacterium]
MAVATIGVTLFLVGAFALVLSNMSGLLERFGREVRLTAYATDGVTPGAGPALAEKIGALPGVARAEWVSKDAALERFRRRLGGEAALLEGLEENPLPASVEVEVAPSHHSSAGLASLREALARLDGVEEVADGHAWVEGYARAVALLHAAAIGLGAVLGLAALLIVTNTIRLAVYARRDEIEILMLVGATRSFVAVPFLLEGLLQGVAGGLLALALLGLGFLALGGALAGAFAFVLGSAEPAFLGAVGCAGLVAAGGVLGVLGSAGAVAQGLRA